MRTFGSPGTALAALFVGLLACDSVTRSGVRMPESEFPPDTLRGAVETIAAIEPPRNSKNPASLERVAHFIAEQMTAAGLKPAFQTFEVDGAKYHNVHAIVGSGNRARIVVGAHYDVFGALPGADDNASGVAALLNVASRLATQTLPTDVEIVAYTLEEPPHFGTANMGSARHAQLLADSGVKVVAMLSLEMLGYYTDALNSQEYPDPNLNKYFPSTGNFLAVLGRSEDGPLLKRIRDAMGGGANRLRVLALSGSTDLRGLDSSDHMSYWRHGFPAIMVTDTAYYRNPNYHKESDRPGTLDYVRMQEAADGVYAAVVALANLKEPIPKAPPVPGR